MPVQAYCPGRTHYSRGGDASLAISVAISSASRLAIPPQFPLAGRAATFSPLLVDDSVDQAPLIFRQRGSRFGQRLGGAASAELLYQFPPSPRGSCFRRGGFRIDLCPATSVKATSGTATSGAAAKGMTSQQGLPLSTARFELPLREQLSPGQLRSNFRNRCLRCRFGMEQPQQQDFPLSRARFEQFLLGATSSGATSV